MYWSAGSSCIDFFKCEWSGVRSCSKLSVYFTWVEIAVISVLLRCGAGCRIQCAECPELISICTQKYIPQQEAALGKWWVFCLFLKPHRLLLHETHKTEMVLQSTGNYVEVIGKGKLKKCGILNSNVRRKSDFSSWDHPKCLPPCWTNLFLKIWPTLPFFT